MLTDDENNLDGLEVLRQMQVLNEGSQRIVLSAQPKNQLTRDILIDYKVFDYLDKDALAEMKDYSLLYDMISRALESCEIVLYGWQKTKYTSGEKIEKKDIITFLAGASEYSSIWVDRCLLTLKPKGGYSGLQRFLSEFFNPLAPLILPVNLGETDNIDEKYKILSGKFWSKCLGEAIETIVFSGENKIDFLKKQLDGKWLKTKEIKHFESSGLVGLAFRMESVKRSSFVEKNP